MTGFRNDLVEQIGGCRSTGVIIDVAAVDVLDSFGFTTIRSVAEVARLRGALPVSSGSSRMWRWPRSGSGWAPARSPPLSTSTRAWPASTGSTLELRRRLDEPRSELACLGRGLIARSPSAERQFERWRPRPASSGEAGGRGLCERVSAWTPLRSRGSYGSGGCWATGEDERSPSGPDAWEARAARSGERPAGGEIRCQSVFLTVVAPGDVPAGTGSKATGGRPGNTTPGTVTRSVPWHDAGSERGLRRCGAGAQALVSAVRLVMAERGGRLVWCRAARRIGGCHVQP